MSLLQSPISLREEGLSAAIRQGLLGHPKRLPPECFYDELGSALFEAITVLPEYGLTRADLRLLTSHGGRIASQLRGPLDIVELGSGGGRKAKRLLQTTGWPASVRYRPIDVSSAALDDCLERFSALRGVEVLPILGGYLEGLEQAVERRKPGASLLVLFLGSNLGNFERAAAHDFLRAIRARLGRGDALLVSVDLEKSEGRLLAAYDDAAGVTAAFNRNALARLNRELHADFDVLAFQHRALYDATERRIEMHLVPMTDELVQVKKLGLEVWIGAGEGIWTESSHKFAPGELAALGRDTGFWCSAEWVDSEWPYCLGLLFAN
ncbi:MAG TPA: L-histidine N(alpha)-methyltransferase [Vicinamibacteria bacterium]